MKYGRLFGYSALQLQFFEDAFGNRLDDRHDRPPESREIGYFATLGGMGEASPRAGLGAGAQKHPGQSESHCGVEEAGLHGGDTDTVRCQPGTETLEIGVEPSLAGPI